MQCNLNKRAAIKINLAHLCLSTLRLFDHIKYGIYILRYKCSQDILIKGIHTIHEVVLLCFFKRQGVIVKRRLAVKLRLALAITAVLSVVGKLSVSYLEPHTFQCSFS